MCFYNNKCKKNSLFYKIVNFYIYIKKSHVNSLINLLSVNFFFHNPKWVRSLVFGTTDLKHVLDWEYIRTRTSVKDKKILSILFQMKTFYLLKSQMLILLLILFFLIKDFRNLNSNKKFLIYFGKFHDFLSKSLLNVPRNFQWC